MSVFVNMSYNLRRLTQGIEDLCRRLISLCSQAKQRDWETFKMSLEAASDGSQKIQVEVDQSLRRVNMTDHNLEQLQGLQVSGIYCLAFVVLRAEQT